MTDDQLRALIANRRPTGVLNRNPPNNWPLPTYPKNPPPLRMFGAAELPECNVVHDGAELAVRYEVTRDGDCYLRAIKVNGSWHDPVAWLSPSAIKCMENDCAEIEREVRAEGDE